MSAIIQPFRRQAEVMHDAYTKGFVTVQGGPPCVIIETFGDEAIIKAIADGFNHKAGQEFCVAKKDLMPAEVMFVDCDERDPKPAPADPDWNLIIGREREYSKNSGNSR